MCDGARYTAVQVDFHGRKEAFDQVRNETVVRFVSHTTGSPSVAGVKSPVAAIV